MKTRLYFYCFIGIVFLGGCASLETRNQYPIDNIENIIESKQNRNQLYSSIKIRISENYSNAKAIIDYEDKDSGVIVIKGKELFSTWYMTARLDYWVKIEIKDNKVRYSINNFHGYWYNNGEWVERNWMSGELYIDEKRTDYYRVYSNICTTINNIVKDAASNEKSSW